MDEVGRHLPILRPYHQILGRLGANLGPKGQKSRVKISRNIAGTGATRNVFDYLEVKFKTLCSVTSFRGGGLKTPAAIDRRPVFLALGRRLHASIDASSHEWIKACNSQDRSVFHSFVFILTKKDLWKFVCSIAYRRPPAALSMFT